MITHSRIFRITWNTVLLIALAAASVAGQSVKIKSNANRDISKCSRYAWTEHKIALAQKPEVISEIDKKIKAAFNREMALKGYVEEPKNPEILIQVVAYGAPDLRPSANVDMRYPSNYDVYTSQRPDGAGISIWMDIISNVSFILSDPSSKDVLWQADLTKRYTNPEKAIRNLDKEIQNIVHKALKDLPAHKK